MVAYFREGARPQAVAAAALCVLGMLGAYAAVAMAGTKTGMALAAICVFGPAFLYAALVSPLAFPFAIYIALVPFDNILAWGNNGSYTRMIAMASAAAMVFYMIRTKRASSPPKLMAVWFLLYLWMFASSFWAIDPTATFQLLPTALQLFGLYFIASLMPVTGKELRGIVLTIIVSFVAAAAYGAYLFHSGAGVGAGGRLWIGNGDNSYIDPNHFAAALLLPSALLIVSVLQARNWLARIAYAAGLLVVLAGLAVSSSRGAMLGLACIILYLFFKTPWRKQLGALMFVLACAAGGMFSQALSRFSDAISTGGAGRTDIWKVGWLALKSHWLIGAGYYNFAQAYDQAFIRVPEHYYTRWDRAPHDLLLGTAVEIGIIGLALTLAAWFGHFKVLAHIGPADPRYGLRRACEASLIGLFVAALFLDVMAMKYVWLMFILVMLVRNATAEKALNGSDVRSVLPSLR